MWGTKTVSRDQQQTCLLNWFTYRDNQQPKQVKPIIYRDQINAGQNLVYPIFIRLKNVEKKPKTRKIVRM
jgi:hypothetical protein